MTSNNISNRVLAELGVRHFVRVTLADAMIIQTKKSESISDDFIQEMNKHIQDEFVKIAKNEAQKMINEIVIKAKEENLI